MTQNLYSKQKNLVSRHLITTEGIKPNLNKVKATQNMPASTDIHGVKRVCGMMHYLAKFIPNLSVTIDPKSLVLQEKIIAGTGTRNVPKHLKLLKSK